MRNLTPYHRLAGLAVGVLLLAATSCNHVGDDPGDAEAVIQVTGVSTSGTSLAAAEDTKATITFSVFDRNGSSTNFVNNVTFDSFSVTFTPTAVVPDLVGSANGVYFPIGSSGNSMTFGLVPQGSRPAAGTVLLADIQVEGHDQLNRSVNFDVTVSLSFTP